MGKMRLRLRPSGATSDRRKAVALLLSIVLCVGALIGLVLRQPEAGAASVSITEAGIKKNNVVWYYKDGHSKAWGESLYFKGSDGKQYFCVEPEKNFRAGSFSPCGSLFSAEITRQFALALYWGRQNVSGDLGYTVGQIIA